MDKLKALLDGCKCGVTIEVNVHRDHYDSVEKEIEEINEILDMAKDDPLPKEVAEGMIRTGNVIKLHFYPDTPIGFYCVYHYDIDKALDEALECLRAN